MILALSPGQSVQANKAAPKASLWIWDFRLADEQAICQAKTIILEVCHSLQIHNHLLQTGSHRKRKKNWNAPCIKSYGYDITKGSGNKFQEEKFTWLHIRLWPLEQSSLALLLNFVCQLQISSSPSPEIRITFEVIASFSTMMQIKCVLWHINWSNKSIFHTAGWTNDLFAFRLCKIKYVVLKWLVSLKKMLLLYIY